MDGRGYSLNGRKKTQRKAQPALAASRRVVLKRSSQSHLQKRATSHATKGEEYTLELLINPTCFTSSSPSSVQFKLDKTKECYQLLGTLSCSSTGTCERQFHLPHFKKKKKKKKSIYRENKVLSHGLYNWAYTLFTAQSLIQKKNVHSVGKANGHHSSSLSCR